MDIFFANDIKKGFTSKNKFIPDRDYYDEIGSNFFQELMINEDYYVYKSETEIFNNYKKQIIGLLNLDNKPFNLIEFGAGDATKTSILIDELLSLNYNFNYIPIDFSEKYINDLISKFSVKFPKLNILPQKKDYFDALNDIKSDGLKNIVLFIGSSIGGLNKSETIVFLKKLSAILNHNDFLFIGFDLKKNPEIIYNAYHNTCNLWCKHLLTRINSELGGNLVIDNFKYYTNYNPVNGKFKWYFISLLNQDVFIKNLNLIVHFDKFEPIYIGQSKKFTELEINKLAKKNDFEIVENFTDNKEYFINSLWCNIKKNR